MNELTKTIALTSRHKTLFLLVVLLAVAGVADRYYHQDQQVVIGSSQMLTAGLPTPDETPGNAAGTSDPHDDGAAAQLVQFVMQKDNGPSRTKLRTRIAGLSSARNDVKLQVGALFSTASLVDSRLGRQFTLVGAKPSGTS